MNFANIFKKKYIVGLALSGGATYGAAHIGVLRVLEREGIRPDFVAGTSAGALVGAAYCAGISLDEISTIFLSMNWPNLLKLAVTKPLALFDTQPMAELLKRKVGDCDFSDLDIPFSATCCDIVTGEKVIIDSGPLIPAIQASAAIPGLFLPVEIDGRMLVDGGVVDNIPVEQVKIKGATYTIVSDVSKRGAKSKKPGNLIEVLLSTFDILQERSALADIRDCDCYIRPEVQQFSSFDFSDSDKMMEAGMKAAELMLGELSKIKPRS